MSVVTVVRGSRPYEHEPLAPSSELDVGDDDLVQKADEDGLTAAILEKRYLREIVLGDW